MDCSALVLSKLLTERNLDIWAKLKLAFLDTAYSSIYSAISRYYDKYNAVPSFEELEIVIREGLGQKTLATLKLIDEPDISAEVALDALIDQYTQNLTIAELDKFIDKLPIYDSNEVKENLNSIVIRLDEKTLTTETVYSMSEIMLFQTNDELSADRVYLGINNTFDSTLGGVAREELILIGGPRGGGKSITASNMIINQYEAGNTSVYFSIEMKASEVFQRKMAILAGVPYMQLKNNNLSEADLLKVVRARAGMFEDSAPLVEQYLQHRDRFKFENALVKQNLKLDNQIIIVDDRAPTLTSIDLHIGKLKARFKEKLTLVVIDYLNQVVHEGSGNHTDQFDWKPQIVISKGLKNLARKHGVVIASPYQIDNSGEARFAKGILDAADIGIIMELHDKAENAMSYKTTKIRGGPDISFTSPIDWDTLRVSPESINKPEAKEKIKKVKTSKVVDDAKADIPWDT